MPPGITAAARETLIGRWEVVRSNGRGDHDDGRVEFTSRQLRGHDGCNEFNGVRWSIGDGGLFTARGGGSTTKLCARPSLLMSGFVVDPGIARLGHLGGQLVAYGQRGKELGRLSRA